MDRDFVYRRTVSMETCREERGIALLICAHFRPYLLNAVDKVVLKAFFMNYLLDYLYDETPILNMWLTRLTVQTRYTLEKQSTVHRSMLPSIIFLNL